MLTSLYQSQVGIDIGISNGSNGRLNDRWTVNSHKPEESISTKDKCDSQIAICRWEKRSEKCSDGFSNCYSQTCFNKQFQTVEQNDWDSKWNQVFKYLRDIWWNFFWHANGDIIFHTNLVDINRNEGCDEGCQKTFGSHEGSQEATFLGRFSRHEEEADHRSQHSRQEVNLVCRRQVAVDRVCQSLCSGPSHKESQNPHRIAIRGH